MMLRRVLLVVLLIVGLVWVTPRCEVTFVDGTTARGLRALPYCLMYLPLAVCWVVTGATVGAIVFTKAKISGQSQVKLWGNTYEVTWEGESDARTR